MDLGDLKTAAKDMLDTFKAKLPDRYGSKYWTAAKTREVMGWKIGKGHDPLHKVNVPE
jgi:hypothetical protein